MDEAWSVTTEGRHPGSDGTVVLRDLNSFRVHYEAGEKRPAAVEMEVRYQELLDHTNAARASAAIHERSILS